MDVKIEVAKFFMVFWLPSVSRILLSKKEPACLEGKKVCCRKLDCVVLFYKATNNFSPCPLTEILDEFEKNILVVGYLSPFFLTPISALILKFGCNFVIQESLIVSFMDLQDCAWVSRKTKRTYLQTPSDMHKFSKQICSRTFLREFMSIPLIH